MNRIKVMQFYFKSGHTIRDTIELNWIELNWIELNWIESNQIIKSSWVIISYHIIWYQAKSSQVKSDDKIIKELYDIVSIGFSSIQFHSIQVGLIRFGSGWFDQVRLRSVQDQNKFKVITSNIQVKSSRVESSQVTLDKRTQGDIDMVYVNQANRVERKWIWEKKFYVVSCHAIPYHVKSGQGNSSQ